MILHLLDKSCKKKIDRNIKKKIDNNKTISTKDKQIRMFTD